VPAKSGIVPRGPTLEFVSLNPSHIRLRFPDAVQREAVHR